MLLQMMTLIIIMMIIVIQQDRDVQEEDYGMVVVLKHSPLSANRCQTDAIVCGGVPGSRSGPRRTTRNRNAPSTRLGFFLNSLFRSQVGSFVRESFNYRKQAAITAV